MNNTKKTTFDESTQHLIDAKITCVDGYQSDEFTTIESFIVEATDGRQFLISRDEFNTDMTELDVVKLKRSIL